ncbi:MAG: hypothetical protein JKX85_12420 [Phycisphaeraceae bacterium]|nr:hypothetical protein [Phycisphaeraceae bacterium]
MKQKIATIVLGMLGLIFISGCNSTQIKGLRCLPCEAAKAQVIRVTPEPVARAPVSDCLPCQQQVVQQYVAPTPAPAPVLKDCLECVDGQPDYSRYQWH